MKDVEASVGTAKRLIIGEKRIRISLFPPEAE